MLSIEQCKKTLNKGGIMYTDEEVRQIREFLYFIAEMDYNLFHQRLEREQATPAKEETKIIQLNPNTNETESNPLHPGIYRRAS